jgi:hypothetical protein
MMSKGDNPIMPRRQAEPEDFDGPQDHDDDDFVATGSDGIHLPTFTPSRRVRAAQANASAWQDDEWEELTEVDGRFLLRHDGKVFAAVEVPADSIIAQAFKPARSEPIKTGPA